MIVNEEQYRAIQFIAEVNRGGFRPTGRQINQWRLQSDPKPGRRGELLEPEVPATPPRSVRKSGPTALEVAMGGAFKQQSLISDALRKQIAGMGAISSMNLSRTLMRDVLAASNFVNQSLGWEYETIPGKAGKAAVYGRDKQPEKFLAHLRRLEWVERGAKGGYGVTLLGHALLRAEASSELGDDDSSVMVLAADDELAYGRVMGVISECGDAFIMDAYLGTEEMINILKHSGASRFLVGDKLQKNRLIELAALIELTLVKIGGAARELRQAAFHDRWVVGDHKVYGLGASINGVGGKSMTTLIEMPDAAARFIRDAAEGLWSDAKVIAETREANNEPEDDDEGKVIREDKGRYLHDGCDVRHKTERAAENCTIGS